MAPHSRGAICVRVMHPTVAPSEDREGAGNAGCTPHPPPRVQTKKTHAGQHRYAEITPALPAQWLYGLLRALPGVSGVLVTVAAQNRFAQLDPSIEGTGPHGLTVRVAPHVFDATRPSQPAPRIVTIAKRPSCGRDGFVNS